MDLVKLNNGHPDQGSMLQVYIQEQCGGLSIVASLMLGYSQPNNPCLQVCSRCRSKPARSCLLAPTLKSQLTSSEQITRLGVMSWLENAIEQFLK